MLKGTLKLMPDRLLCQRLKDDPRAGDCLFERYIGPISAYLKQHFTGIECDDVAQEALLCCLTISSLDGVENFRSYAYKAEIRLARKVNAHAHRFQQVSLDTVQEDRVREPALVSEDIAVEQIEQVWIQQTCLVLKEAMRDLTPKVRDVCLLFYIDGMTVTNRADRLGISTGAVKDRLDEGRKKMRAHPKVIRFCDENSEVNSK